MRKLSVVLATRNEEENIKACLSTVADVADEIIVVDEESEDKTREIAKKFGARVYKVKHKDIFHKTKQKALDYATGDWILQLDADEQLTKKLAKEIKRVINMTDAQIKSRKIKSRKKNRLFKRHEELIRKREGKLGKKGGEVVAFFVARRNNFLGKPLLHGGVYPDGVIRLVKRGKARFPAKSVHELMEIDGEVAWLFNDLEHNDTPTFNRYIHRANRYTDLTANEYKKKGIAANIPMLLYFSFIKPSFVFLKLYFWHKGFLDRTRGFIWSLFSAMHFPIAYFKYWQKVKS